MKSKNKKYYNLAGFLGLLGLLGFRYFETGDPAQLFYFANFAFFSSFLLGNINRELPDERWFRNSYAAARYAFYVAASAIFIIGFSAAAGGASREVVILESVIGWNAAIFTYAILFYRYERG